MSAKHTPGPWKVIIYDAGDVDYLSGAPSVVSDAHDCGIVHTKGFVQQHWRSARGDAEIHANARLIAAAPELLEAAQAALEWMDDPALIEQLTVAISKALGENT